MAFYVQDVRYFARGRDAGSEDVQDVRYLKVIGRWSLVNESILERRRLNGDSQRLMLAYMKFALFVFSFMLYIRKRTLTNARAVLDYS